MNGCRSLGIESAAINKPYILVGNFPLSLMTLQCRSSLVRVSSRLSEDWPPRSIGVVSIGRSHYDAPADKAEGLAKYI